MSKPLVQPSSNFFSEGGDSIRAITVAVEARQQNVMVAVQDIFSYPVLGQLAAYADSTGSTPQQSMTRAFELLADEDRAKLPQGLVDAYPLSQLQLGMIFHNEAYGDGRYHDIFSYRLEIALDMSRLREAVLKVVERHPALRTTFDLATYSEPIQMVWSQGAEVLEEENITHLAPAEQATRIESWLTQERVRRFDIGRLPLIRFHVHRLGEHQIQFTTSFHHAVIDGWSDQQIHSEIFADYRALASDGNACASAPQSIYRDFVAIERRSLAATESRRFWRELFADADYDASDLTPGPTPLFNESEDVCTQLIDPPPFVQQGLLRAAQTMGVPLSSVLLACHLVSLSVITGQAEVISCYVSNCRLDEPDGERAIGLYINTLPIRMVIDARVWADVVCRVDGFVRNAYAHRRLPFAEIQREAGNSSKFQSLFYYTNFHNGIPETTDLVLHDKSAFEVTSFPLTASFNLAPRTDHITLNLTCNPRTMPRVRTKLFASVFLKTMISLAAGEQSPLPRGESVPLDMRSIVVGPTFDGLGADLTIIDRLRRQVALNGGRVAVAAPDGEMTYDELNSRSDELARALVARGLEAEDVVGLLVPRTSVLPVALLGILKSGASFVIIDPKDPPQRVRWLMDEVDFVVCTAVEDYGVFGTKMEKIIETSRLAPAEQAVLPAPSERQAMYRMYTSGSTGLPKGVDIEHGSVQNVMRYFQSILDLRPEDRVLLTSALTFDVSVLEWALPLTVGATLVVLEREDLVDLTSFAAVVDRVKPTVIQGTPSFWAALRANGWRPKLPIKCLSGGEALSDHISAWLCDIGVRAWNLYGPTETTIWSTTKELSPSDRSLGLPITGTRCYLLDTLLDAVAQGSVGELFIGGVGVARGYSGRADLSAASFLPDPFSDNGDRMYRTGDLAMMAEGGDLVFLGRRDQQVKISGHRLDLEGIETRLRDHPGIAEVVVIASCDVIGGLVGYIIPRNPDVVSDSDGAIVQSERLTNSHLHRHLSEFLPPHAIPARYVFMEALPRTQNGKLDLKALPVPRIGRPHLSSTYLGPSRPVERLLKTLWSRVLKIEEIGVDDNFVELGGYSLTAMRVVAQLRQLLSIEVPVSVLFSAPTIRRFSDHLLSAYPSANVETKIEVLLSII